MPAYFGLDIGSTSVKIILSDGSRVRTITIGANNFGKSVPNMSNAEKITFADQLKAMISDSGMKPKQVVASVPESSVFSRVLKFPVMSTPELSTAIKWELDQSVPFPPNEIESSWSVMEKPSKFEGTEKISVYVVAVPTNISEMYVQILELIGLEPVRLENEIPALVRTFGPILNDESPSAILDLGASGTNMIIAGKEKIFGSFYIPVGGQALTRLIVEAFSLPITQAESYKRTYGLSKDKFEGKMVTVLKPVIDNIVNELKKLMISYSDDHKDSSVRRLILTGGGAYLIGLVPYLSEAFGGVEVVIGDTFVNMAVDEKYKGLGPVFAIANGLSL